MVFTPLLGAALLRERVAANVWVAIALATTGLGVLALRGATLGIGELLTLAGALVCALHIVALGAWSQARYAIELAVIQAATTAVICALFALPGGITLPTARADWLGLIYMAVVVGAVTMLMQTWAQSQLHASRAAIVMTLEPVWATVFAVVLGGEVLGWRVAVGGALVLGAMYLCERGPATATSAATPQAPGSPRGRAPRNAWRWLPQPRRSSTGSSRTARSECWPRP